VFDGRVETPPDGVNNRRGAADTGPMPFVRAVPLLAAAVLVPAGLASGTLTTAQYRTRANAACAAEQARMKALGDPSKLANAQLAAYDVSQAAALVQEYATLRALHPPQSLLAAHRTALWNLYRLVQLNEAIAAKVQSGVDPTAAANQLAKPSDWDALMNMLKAWGQAGVRTCGTLTIRAHWGS